MTAIDNVVKDIRARIAETTLGDPQWRDTIQSVAEVAAAIDVEYDKWKAGKAVLTLSDPTGAAIFDVRTRLWDACGIGAANERYLVRDNFLPDGHRRDYDIEVERLAELAMNILSRRWSAGASG